MTTTTMIVVGQGVLTWPSVERISDRYGTVGLMAEGSNSWTAGDPGWVDVHRALPEGRRGRLQALVLTTRKSNHIGDFFRSLYPSTPEVGDVIVLGDGTVFHGWARDAHGDGALVGLVPDDSRDTDWLDPAQLYRAHEQTVELQFIPAR